MKLTAGSKTLAQALLVWDRARIDKRVADGLDATHYRARQDRADSDLPTEVEGWDRYTLDILRSLLETTRVCAMVPENIHLWEFQAGRVVRQLSVEEVATYHQLARELEMLGCLHEVAPTQWPKE
jgi:hypothetical protein